jgi:hypothetical protein
VDLNRDNRVEVEPLPPFRFRLPCDPPSLIPSTAIAQVFELLIGTATVDLDLLGRSVGERQLQDVRHVAREHNYASDTGTASPTERTAIRLIVRPFPPAVKYRSPDERSAGADDDEGEVRH